MELIKKTNSFAIRIKLENYKMLKNFTHGAYKLPSEEREELEEFDSSMQEESLIEEEKIENVRFYIFYYYLYQYYNFITTDCLLSIF